MHAVADSVTDPSLGWTWGSATMAVMTLVTAVTMLLVIVWIRRKTSAISARDVAVNERIAGLEREAMRQVRGLADEVESLKAIATALARPQDCIEPLIEILRRRHRPTTASGPHGEFDSLGDLAVDLLARHGSAALVPVSKAIAEHLIPESSAVAVAERVIDAEDKLIEALRHGMPSRGYCEALLRSRFAGAKTMDWVAESAPEPFLAWAAGEGGVPGLTEHPVATRRMGEMESRRRADEAKRQKEEDSRRKIMEHNALVDDMDEYFGGDTKKYKARHIEIE